jgi:hypothetical protein
MSGAVFGGLVLQNYGLLKSALNYTVLIYTLLESGCDEKVCEINSWSMEEF